MNVYNFILQPWIIKCIHVSMHALHLGFTSFFELFTGVAALQIKEHKLHMTSQWIDSRLISLVNSIATMWRTKTSKREIFLNHRRCSLSSFCHDHGKLLTLNQMIMLENKWRRRSLEDSPHGNCHTHNRKVETSKPNHEDYL